MNKDLEIDEYKATATPRDWQADFNFVGGHALHTCANCLTPFRSFPFRELCCLCNPSGCALEAKKAPV